MRRPPCILDADDRTNSEHIEAQIRQGCVLVSTHGVMGRSPWALLAI
jgi:hypothetical protein